MGRERKEEERGQREKRGGCRGRQGTRVGKRRPRGVREDDHTNWGHFTSHFMSSHKLGHVTSHFCKSRQK